ncbi:hypothetical protein ALC62_11735, partial [Cyphomyrmex costatus]
VSMTGVHLIFLIRDYTSSSESASASKRTRWAFRDVSNPTEQFILPSLFSLFLLKQQGRQCATKDFREAEEASLFNEPYTVPGRRDDVTAIRINSYFSRFFFLFHYRTGGTFNELSLSKRNEDEAREIFRTGVDYLGGSFLELRAVTRNRMLESETDPTIEQVYNGFCRGGNDCNHHSSLGKWKFGSPTLPLFNTVDSNDCSWTEEYLLNYYRLLAETRRSKCHGDRVEKSVVRRLTMRDATTLDVCALLLAAARRNIRDMRMYVVYVYMIYVYTCCLNTHTFCMIQPRHACIY